MSFDVLNTSLEPCDSGLGMSSAAISMGVAGLEFMPSPVTRFETDLSTSEEFSSSISMYFIKAVGASAQKKRQWSFSCLTVIRKIENETLEMLWQSLGGNKNVV